MASMFTWLDYSEHERRKMLDVISLFRERDMRDEMEIGTVCDAFADMLFPGTGTIQRRARHFMFVPWMCLELEQRRVPSGQITTRARQEGIALVTNGEIRPQESTLLKEVWHVSDRRRNGAAGESCRAQALGRRQTCPRDDAHAR